MNTVAKAAPDGRTLLFSPSGNIVISPSLQSNLPYDAVTAFEPIALVGSVKTALIVRASLEVKTLAELIALAKGGAKLTFGSPGPGTSPHISGEMLNHAAGIAHDARAVPRPRTGAQQSARRAYRPHHHLGDRRAALCRSEDGARAGGVRQRAVRAAAGCADHGRARLSGSGDAAMVRPTGARGTCRRTCGPRSSSRC